MRVDNGQLRCKVPIGFMRKCGKLGICRGKSGHRTTLSFRTSAHYFRGNLHRISGYLSSYRPFFLCCFSESTCMLSKNGASIRGIATPVCGLVRNDREFGFAMTGNSMARQIPICRTAERYRAGQVGNENRPRSSRLGRPPCGQIPIVHCQLSIHYWR